MSGIEKRVKGKLGNPGPFLAEITNHLDPEVMGSVEVALIKLLPNYTRIKGDVYPVRYLSPFYGVTNKRFVGSNKEKYNDTQKSYGMWMAPPDVGTTVLVIFIDGDPNQGYVMGCVPDRYQNFMLPGIAASEYVHITAEEKTKYNFGDKVTTMPVAEFNTSGEDNLNAANINSIKKPIHPFADRLVEQGLLADDVRGVTSSSARREQPSYVFGISTPGPIDVSGPKQQIGYDTKREVPFSRLGGTTFVMDDGDINGNNELVRIRTRTGHQILLHNTKDLIYIANSKGTAWLEMTSNGKIDIYAQDSVSIHSENDFNFRAKRDINLEAGRNMNMSSGETTNVNSTGALSMAGNGDGKVKFGKMHFTSSSDIRYDVAGSFDIKSSSTFKVYAGANASIGSDANVLIRGSNIHLNGENTKEVKDEQDNRQQAEQPKTLPTFSLPATKYKKDGWGNKKYYKTDNITSIMKRVPMHEPWEHHESNDPSQLTPESTDADSVPPATPQGAQGPKSPVTPATPSRVTVKDPPNQTGTPPTPTGDKERDNLNAFLWTIRVVEGTSGPNGYRTQFTGVLFDSFADHPRKVIAAPIKGKLTRSSAAGAYQFLSTTWDMCRDALKLTDFSPPNQDKAAVYLLQRINALDDIKNGNFNAALRKSNRIWYGLPGNPNNDQNPRSYSATLAAYKQAGGTVAD